jgi:hypothetical protein
MGRDVEGAAPNWRIVAIGIFEINQAFSRILAVAASAAIALWSIAGVRNGGLGRGLATYGCVVGLLITVGVAIGHLRMDVHGMTAVAVAQTIWFVVAGYRIYAAHTT